MPSVLPIHSATGSCMSVEQEMIEPDQKESEFGRGYFLLFGLGAGLFVTVVVAVAVLIITAPSPVVSAEPTVPVAGGGPGDASNGEELFAQTCVACHGAGGIGVDGLGPGLIGNEFVAALSDDQLVEFLETGRPADHPDNESGITMPPKGGNPSLDDEDLADIASYLRTLN